MAKRTRDEIRPGVIERLRHPSPRAKLFTFIAICVFSSIYLTVSTIWNDSKKSASSCCGIHSRPRAIICVWMA